MLFRSLGLAPVTTCTDLLKPGGYGRLPKYLDNLEERMRKQGVRSVADFVASSGGAGPETLARIVARVTADPRYRSDSLRPPRKIGRSLALFDCINCDKCLPACPNDANFVYEVEPLALDYVNYRVERGTAVPAEGGRFEVHERHQIACFQDFCNDCGNCDTFCPEDGGPYLEKPRFFGSLETFRRHADRDGFHVGTRAGAVVIWGRLHGAEYRLELDRRADQAVFTDGRVTLELRHHDRAPVGAAAAPGAPEGHTLDVGAYLTLALVLDGVLDPRRSHPVNA